MERKEFYDILDIQKALELINTSHFQEALDLLMGIYVSQVNDFGRDSSFLNYYIAITYDYLERPLRAVPFIEKAILLDPLNIHIENSCNLIYKHLGDHLNWLINHFPQNPEVEEIYKLLLNNGHITEDVQKCMIHYFIKNNDYNNARPLLLNALARNPNDITLKYYNKVISEKDDENDTSECNQRISLGLH